MVSPFDTINVSSVKPIVIVSLGIGSQSIALKAMFQEGSSTDPCGTRHDNPSIMETPYAS